MYRIMPMIVLLALPALAHAQAETFALSPEARAKVLDAAERGGGALDDLPVNGLGRQVHGEVGAFVGTGGARGVFGSAALPLGDDGMASFSFEKSRYGRSR